MEPNADSDDSSELSEEFAYSSDCAYLPNRTTRLIFRLGMECDDGDGFDAAMEAGDRRSGLMLYHPACENCRACEPIRVPLAQFQPSSTQRRIRRKGDSKFTLRVSEPVVNAEHIALFNKHRHTRGLEREDGAIDRAGYEDFLTDSYADTREFGYYLENRLVACAITDVGTTCLSAVYCFYDTDLLSDSLGTYSILKQIEWGVQHRKQFLYLGYYVGGSETMAYKANFLPHQRKIAGRWQGFSR